MQVIRVEGGEKKAPVFFRDIKKILSSIGMKRKVRVHMCAYTKLELKLENINLLNDRLIVFTHFVLTSD